jgi:hypothetical protein
MRRTNQLLSDCNAGALSNSVLGGNNVVRHARLDRGHVRYGGRGVVPSGPVQFVGPAADESDGRAGELSPRSPTSAVVENTRSGRAKGPNLALSRAVSDCAWPYWNVQASCGMSR